MEQIPAELGWCAFTVTMTHVLMLMLTDFIQRPEVSWVNDGKWCVTSHRMIFYRRIVALYHLSLAVLVNLCSSRSKSRICSSWLSLLARLCENRAGSLWLVDDVTHRVKPRLVIQLLNTLGFWIANHCFQHRCRVHLFGAWITSCAPCRCLLVLRGLVGILQVHVEARTRGSTADLCSLSSPRFEISYERFLPAGRCYSGPVPDGVSLSTETSQQCLKSNIKQAARAAIDS